MKPNFYMIATIVLVAIITGFIIFSSLGGENVSSAAVAAEDLGDYQKAVLSLKGYNYYPSVIEVQAGKPVRMYLDSSVQGCYRSIVIPAFDVRKNLLSADDYVEFVPEKAGTYDFACSMGMGTGKIVVK